jgi:DNA-binding transcriptional LysR family regulator
VRRCDVAKKANKRPQMTFELAQFIFKLGSKIKGGHKTYGSIREVAEDLGHSHAHVYERIETLRKICNNEPVVEYREAAFRLTPEGIAVFEWATGVMEQFERGLVWPIGGRQTFDIGTNNPVLYFLLPEVITAFNRSHPKVDLRFREYYLPNIIEDLRARKIHAGLGGAYIECPKSLEVEKLRSNIRTTMIASPEHPYWGEGGKKRHGKPVLMSELAGETVCAVAGDDELIGMLPPPSEAGSRILVETQPPVVALVKARVGVGFIIDFDEVDGYHRDLGLYVYPAPEIPTRTLAIWKRAREELPGPLEEFFGQLKRVVGAQRSSPRASPLPR